MKNLEEEALAMGKIASEYNIQFALDLLGLTKQEWLDLKEGKARHYQRVAYRKGYHHGFIFSRQNPKTTEEEVSDWRDQQKRVGPPGSPMEGNPFEF